MSISLLFIYLISSIILFFILNYIEKKDKNNYINQVLIPIIYIILLAGILSISRIDSNNDNIFLIVVFEFIIRIFYTSYVLEKNFFKENNYWWFTILSSYLINYTFIKNTDNVFPNTTELKMIIWPLILIYLYNFIKKNITIKNNNNTWIYYQDKDYIVMQYAKFKNNYYNLVITKYNILKPLVYAIMIYENYNRPEILRKFDKIKFRIDNEQNKFGIMQITSKNILSDEESIKLSIKKLEKIYLKLTRNKRTNNLIKDILNNYYKNNIIVEEIINIYNEIRLFNDR